MNEYERVRKKVSQYIHQCNLELGLRTLRKKPQTADEVDSIFEPTITQWVSRILSIKNVAILSDDQSLPKLVPDDAPHDYGKGYAMGERQFAQTMLQADFRRVVVKVVEKTVHQVGFDMKEEK